nr:MAG TPA: ERF superfamily protein [Caudoviricetes sp.]
MNKSEQINELAKALADFQSEVKDPSKDKENPYFKSKYVALDGVLQTVRPVLAKHGLSVMQLPTSDETAVTVTTLLMHSSGQFIESEPFKVLLTKKDAQAAGSALTYARRYSLSSVLGIAWDDDDDGDSIAETNVTKELLAEIQELAQVKNIENKNVSNFIRATFNKTSAKLLDMQQLQQLKAWLAAQ